MRGSISRISTFRIYCELCKIKLKIVWSVLALGAEIILLVLSKSSWWCDEYEYEFRTKPAWPLAPIYLLYDWFCSGHGELYDFNDYTHIAIVDVLNSAGRRGKSGFNNVFKALISSPLTILNPTSDKNKFKENSFYLRNTKNPKWLYLYYTASRIGVDLTVSIILRNLENEIVYSASSINIPFREVLNQVANGSLTLNENLGIIKEKNTNFDGVEKEVIGRDEAIKRIKEAKDLFDTGILSQEEYDKLVAKYKVIIMAN